MIYRHIYDSVALLSFFYSIDILMKSFTLLFTTNTKILGKVA